MKSVTQNSILKGLAAMLCFMLVGCVNIPDSIKGNSAKPLENFTFIQQNPSLFIGQEARFGGIVVNVTNTKRGTRLEMTSIPLDNDAKPKLGIASQGRFIADIDQLLDPVDYKNHYVTVVGNIIGTEKGKIGKAPYNFIVIGVTGLQRWNVSKQLTYSISSPFFNDPWIDPSFPDFWGPSYGTANVNTVLTE